MPEYFLIATWTNSWSTIAYKRQS